MPELRRMLPSSNALFVFDAAARNGSFTAAAAELNVTQPAVSRMLGRFEQYLGVRLFDRTAGGAILTEEGELLYRRVVDGFRSIETGLIEIERRRRGTETVTLSLSSAFTTHWLMPRIDKLQRRFPNVDLRFQLIAGSLRGPVENVDFGMRFRDRDDPDSNGALVMKEVMLPICSPGYRDADEEAVEGNTIIRLDETARPRQDAELLGLCRRGASGAARPGDRPWLAHRCIPLALDRCAGSGFRSAFHHATDLRIHPPAQSSHPTDCRRDQGLDHRADAQ
jgi:DNA-binding transcriptional LysR family regulator